VPVRISIDIDDAEVKRFFAPNGFIKKFNKHFSQQMLGFHKHMKSEIRKQMDSGKYPPLGITQYIGRSGVREPTKVFHDTGRFKESLKAHYVRESRYLSGVDFAFEGVSPNGLPYNKLAWILEEGRTWVPTEKERTAVAMMAKRRGAPEAEGEVKAQWTIPARSFLRDTFATDAVMTDFVNKTFRAMELAHAELKAGT
jgi:hypothetical protein